MGRLIKFEFRRLFSQKGFYICTGILMLITLLQIRSSWNMRVDLGLDGAGFVQESLINSGTTFLFIILLGIFSALFVCEDYSAGTIRVIITRGYSRAKIYFAKLIVLCIAALIMLCLCWISALATAMVVYDGVNTSMNIMFLLAMFGQALLVIAYACLFNAAASAVQKTGGAIALCIVLPMTVTIILTLLETTLNRGRTGNEIELCKYWLERLISDISIVKPPKETLSLVLRAAPIYAAVTTGLGLLFVFKREY